MRSVTRRRWRSATTRGDAKARPAADLVNRDFSAEGPNQLWVADITYVPTWAGWLHLAVVLDAWSRRIVGWAMASHLRAELVEDALAMAISRRRPRGRVIHHSDRGSQYTSLDFGRRCREAGIVQSMGSAGDAYDNAMCESFFATLECELLDRMRFRTADDARREVFSFIEGFHNTRRLHSALGYQAPARFEEINRDANPGPMARALLHPVGGDNRIHFRHHQPQKPTVRESGAGPRFQNHVEHRPRESGVEGLSPLGPQTSFANPWSGTDSAP